MNTMLRRRIGLLLVLVVVLSVVLPVAASAQGTNPPGGYYYTVKKGDTWSIVSRKLGRTVAELKRVNPRAVHPNGWLYMGERLYVPPRGAKAPAVQSQGSAASGQGYWYTVKPGDTWNIVARSTGVPVVQLWRTNPRLLNPQRWLYIGQRVWIPRAPVAQAATAAPTATEQVVVLNITPEPADTLPFTPTLALTATIPLTASLVMTPALETTPTLALTATLEVPATALVLATPEPALTDVVTPAAEALPAPTITPTLVVTGVVEITPTLTLTPSVVITPALAITPTLVVTPTLEPTPPPTLEPTPLPTLEPTATPLPIATPVVAVKPPEPKPGPVEGCPTTLAEYADAISERLDSRVGTVADLAAWLGVCGAIREADSAGGLLETGMASSDAKDLVIWIRDPVAETAAERGEMLVYHANTADKSYTLARKFVGAGYVDVLRAGEINGDGQADLAWIDTTCGAHTCFSTLFVETWDGSAYRDWVDGEPTMGSADYQFEDALPDVSGEELVVRGGIIGSAGAGPQRSWTEVYGSSEGGPFTLARLEYAPSKCLYHKLLDANTAFGAWTTDGFDPAIAAYQAIVNDTDSEACWTIENELDQLKDFARFRLIVSLVAGGEARKSEAVLATFTNAKVKGAAEAFLTSYRKSGSVIQACRSASTYAEGTPAAWEYLENWGYANPSMTADAMCPLQ